MTAALEDSAVGVEDGVAGTATGPTLRSVTRSARGPVLLGALLLLAGVLVAALRATGDGGLLDPDAYDPSGSHALRVLLEDAGVEVVRLEGTRELAERATSSSTVLVAQPEALTPDQRDDLDGLPGELVLVAPPPDLLTLLELDADPRGEVEADRRQPACDLPAAVRAGVVEIGGERWASGAPDAVGCYATGGAATLLRLPGDRATLLGEAWPLTNDGLDAEGAAALGLALLGTQDTLLWVLPAPLESPVPETGRSLWSLYSDGVRTAALGLVLAAVVLALWRARRLGRVVVEPLPVVVRAAEAVEGRARLYQAARARGSAAESLRAGARDRLTRRLGLPLDTGRESLVATVAAKAGRDPGGVDDLLYGAAPGDDAALVRLADALDSVTLEVARS